MLPFNSNFTLLTVTDEAPAIPLAVGGVTQRKTSASEQSANSQDALGALVGSDYIIGVVSDGCTTGYEGAERLGIVSSSNEVGARLLTHAVLTESRRLLTEKSWFLKGKVALNDDFIARLSDAVLKVLSDTVTRYCGNDLKLREYFILHNLMATVLGVIAANEGVLVFGCGDGYFAVNSDIVDLSGEARSYLAKALLPTLCSRKYEEEARNAKLKRHTNIGLEGLQGVLLATDGFAGVHTKDSTFFTDLLNSRPPNAPSVCGYDQIKIEVRRRFATGPARDSEFNDDATLLMLRRLETK
jgi:hypothetical protein